VHLSNFVATAAMSDVSGALTGSICTVDWYVIVLPEKIALQTTNFKQQNMVFFAA
jgi:hypothetical protein